MKIEVFQGIVEALKNGEKISAICSGVPKGWEVSVSDCSVRDIVRDFISDLWSSGFSEGDDLEISFFLSEESLRASYSTAPGWWVDEMEFNALLKMIMRLTKNMRRSIMLVVKNS